MGSESVCGVGQRKTALISFVGAKNSDDRRIFSDPNKRLDDGLHAN
jgi:hypothetical protein